MKINGFEVNTMFVERNEGDIDLFGSFYDNKLHVLTVFRSTKNMSNLAHDIYGGHYTNELFIKKLKDRPYHNFVGQLCGPLSMPISMEKVKFVD